jgi:hypothetical protein
VLRFWRNPLLILHVRSELRPARAAAAAAVTLVVCILIGMGCWSADNGHAQGFFRHFYGWLVACQFVALSAWSAGTCGQAVSREREMKTFDFLRTTRLSAAELLVGKLLGVPMVAYFILACTLPISIVAGLLGGIRPAAVLGSVVLLLAFNLFYSLVALWASMLVEKSSAGSIGLLGLAGNLLALAFTNGSFKGFAAISVLPALFSLHELRQFDMASLSPTVFGVTVPCVILSLVLYVLLGAWFVLMIVRNLKRDLPQIQLLSRWQCVGLVAFCNLLFYAFMDTHISSLGSFGRTTFYYISNNPPYELASFALAWNAILLFLIGVAALSPHEKLKVWWRKWKAGEASYLDPDGLPWPWLLPAAAIAYAMLAAEALGLRSSVPLGEWRLGFVALLFVAFLVFTARDVLFLQWCLLTHMTHPVMKGFLFLVLYYSATGIIGVVASTIAAGSAPKVMSLLNAYSMLGDFRKSPNAPAIILAAIVGQLGFCGLILLAIQRRLARPVHVAEASAA